MGKALNSVAAPNNQAPSAHKGEMMNTPDKWTLLMTGDNNGLVGKFGDTYHGHPDHYGRVDVQRIAAPVAAPAPSEWQPIATAPKDGTRVLLYLGAPWSYVEIACWFSPWGNWQRGEDVPDESKDEYCGIGSAIPSHWMPLPAAPDNKATGA